MSPSRSGAGRQGRGVVGDRLTSGKLSIGAGQRWVFRQASTGFQSGDRRRRAQARLPPAKRSRRPAKAAGMLLLTAVILLEPHVAGTKYTAIAIHGDEEGAKKHANMGFHDHWGKGLDQLVHPREENARVRVGLTTIWGWPSGFVAADRDPAG